MMDDNQELLLTDSLRNSPRNTHKQSQQQEILLVGCDKSQLQTSDITIRLPISTPNILQQVNYRLKSNQQLNLRFLQDQQSSQQDQAQPNMPVQKIDDLAKGSDKDHSVFYYQNLTVKLQFALERIKKKMNSKNELKLQAQKPRKSLFNSRIMRVSSPKEHRKKLNEQQGHLTDRKKSHSMMKTCITQPDQKEYFANIFYKRKNAEKYKTDRIINQQVEKENPSSLKTKRGEPLRTKKEFLASMANWQEKKEKKQQERIEREKELLMAGVTFTPEINARSKQLMKKKGQMLPIYERDIHHIRTQTKHNIKQLPNSKGKK